jgi:RNA polymerase sigma factor (sigma-70 family)
MRPADTLQRTGRRRRSGDAVARLATLAVGGDKGAWADLVEEFGGMVWSIARSQGLSSADAEDAVQATWLRLVENLDRIHDRTRVGGWLATTARRECLSVIRRSGRVRPYGDDLPDVRSDEPAPVDRLIEEERDVAVRDALARLAPRDRALLRMLAAEPSPRYDEIAAALGMAVGSIGPTRARALDRLGLQLA